MKLLSAAIFFTSFSFALCQGTFTVTKLAGGSTVGNINGPAANSLFQSNARVGAITKGLVFIADSGNNGIKYFNETGASVSLLAGSPPNLRFVGCRDGTGSNARFNSPQSLALTEDGNTILVVDTGNNCIRAVTMSGVVTTFAGTCSNTAPADGCGSNPFVSMNNPTSIAVTSSMQYGSTAFVTDSGNCRILAFSLYKQKDVYTANASVFVNLQGEFTTCIESPTSVALSRLNKRVYFSSQDATACYLRSVNFLEGSNVTTLLSVAPDACGPDGIAFSPSADDSSLVLWDRYNQVFQFLDLDSLKNRALPRSDLSPYATLVSSMLATSDGSLIYTSETTLEKLTFDSCDLSANCPAGKFRACSIGYSPGNCVNCSNAPEEAMYTSSGNPITSNNCSWLCNAGFSREFAYSFGTVQTMCVKCKVLDCPAGQYVTNCTTLANSMCAACSDPLPANASYTKSCSVSQTPEEAVLKNAWACNSGFYRNASAAACVRCPQSACGVGQYRGPCGNDTSGCTNCTGLISRAYFSGPGYPFNVDNCSWLCSKSDNPGYFRSGKLCSLCSTSLCGIGKYRGPCGDFADAPCIPCTNPIPDNANYTNNCTGSGTTSMIQTWSDDCLSPYAYTFEF